LKGGIQCGRR